MSRSFILYCFKAGIPIFYCGYMLGCQRVRTVSGHISIIFEEGIPNVVCGYIFGRRVSHTMKINCLCGYFCHCDTIHVLPDNQLSNSAIQRYLYRWYNHFLTLKKRLKCIKSISTFSLSTQHPYREKQTILLPKVASLYLMTVPVVELQRTTSNMYVVHVELMNSVLYLLYLRLELSCHLSKTV